MMLALVCVGLCFASDSAFGVTVRAYGPISVRAEPPTYAQTAGGYAEYRFTIINSSTENDHHVRLVMPANPQGQGHRLRRMERRVRVPAEARVQVSVWQPPLSINGHDVRVFIDGQQQRQTLSLSMNNHASNPGYFFRHWHGTPVQNILVGQGVDAVTRARIEETRSGTSSRSQRQVVRADHSMDRWSDNWLSYCRFHGLALDADELRGAPAPVREAIWSYVRLGGTLLVLGEIDDVVPSPWREQRRRVELDGEAVRAYDTGFGQCWSVDPQTLERWADAGDDRHLRTFFEHGGAIWNHIQSAEQANREFAVIDNLGVPVRGLLAMMIVFAVVIGPVNLLLLARWNRRTWMLWSTPLIAVLFSLAVFGYATFAEGWRAHSRTAGLTLLEEGNRRASTLGWSAFYSPLTPADGLRYDRYTELTPQIGERSYFDRGTARFIDWTEGQHLSAGWVQARIPAHFLVRRSQTRRERMSFAVEPGGTVEVTNGLGADIRLLYVRDAAGAVHRVNDLAAGASARMDRLNDVEEAPAAFRLPDLYESRWLRSIETFTSLTQDSDASTQIRLLMPNTYLAIVDGSPFIEAGLAGAQPRKSESVVHGIMAEPLRMENVHGN